ncbi:MAG: NAD(P)-dependent glycerol-3-phosphate dehydrogenase [Gammaproteobacteria bacterium]|jgi:glycerol-3-phosphate dehydrogenase (NAD(P)+)|nr:NAD(P)-dependent glycerol-3-phosphate dehydrogenase [Gammaproteobacteria bacterium]
MANQSVLVIGAGSWGSALAMVLARNGHQVYLWDIFAEHIAAMETTRSNERYLPGIALPDNLHPVADTSRFSEIHNVVMAMPCAGLQSSLHLLQEHASIADLKICLACKGFEPTSNSLNTNVVKNILGIDSVAVLSGPSFAREVAEGLPTAITVASEHEQTASEFSALFHSEVFRTYTHDDVIGVQVGGAVKNVIAIAAGVADGLGYGANTRCALITRSLAEIMRLGMAMGGRQQTFMGLAGLGDLILTCTDNQSRNRRFGIALAEGKDIETAKQEIGQAIEGAVTTSVVSELAKTYNIEMPITEQVNNVLNSNCSPREAVQNLLAREPKAEM